MQVRPRACFNTGRGASLQVFVLHTYIASDAVPTSPGTLSFDSLRARREQRKHGLAFERVTTRRQRIQRQ